MVQLTRSPDLGAVNQKKTAVTKRPGCAPLSADLAGDPQPKVVVSLQFAAALEKKAGKQIDLLKKNSQRQSAHLDSKSENLDPPAALEKKAEKQTILLNKNPQKQSTHLDSKLPDPPKAIFKGSLFCTLGIPEGSKLLDDITSRGGKILESSYFESSSHLLINGSPLGMQFGGTNVVSQNWISGCCKSNKLNDVPKGCLDIVGKKHHQLFLCPFDEYPELFNLSEAAKRIKKKSFFVITPGSHHGSHRSLVTNDWLRLLVKKSYILLRQLHLAGLTLSGKFDASNFIIYEAFDEILVRFDISESSVMAMTSDGESLDLDRFEQMIRNEMFGKSIPGPELNRWLTMLHDANCRDLMVESVLIMNLEEQSEKFSFLYDTLRNSSDLVHAFVLRALQKYDGWQQVINSSGGNFCLKDTFDRPIDGKSGSQRYNDKAIDLLRLLRNSRQHDALRYSAQYALVIRHNFSNLLGDLQKALFLARNMIP